MPQPLRRLTPARSAQDTFGAELRHWRTLRGLSQADLAGKIHYTPDLVAKVEKADRWPPSDMAASCDGVLDTGGVLQRLMPLVDQQRQAEADARRLDLASGRNRSSINSRRRHPDGLSTRILETASSMKSEHEMTSVTGQPEALLRVSCELPSSAITIAAYPRALALAVEPVRNGSNTLQVPTPPVCSAGGDNNEEKVIGMGYEEATPVELAQQLRGALGHDVQARVTVPDPALTVAAQLLSILPLFLSPDAAPLGELADEVSYVLTDHVSHALEAAEI